MNILYFGTGSFAQPPLRALADNGHSIVGIVTQPDRPAGRGGKLTPPPMKELAIELSLPIFQPESCRTPEFLDTVQRLHPDLIVVAAYGQFLPDALLAIPGYGSVNLHGSLLPRYRGAAPIQRAIWQGETETGVCLMRMVREMDAGDVIACTREQIRDSDNAGTLSARLADDAAALLLQWLPSLATGAAPHHAQDPTQVTFAPPIRKEERVIHWEEPAATIWRQIRALAPSPSAVTHFRGQIVKILAAQPVTNDAHLPKGEPGEIVESNPKIGLYVATGAGVLQVLSLQPAGKRQMPTADFLRGSHLVVGERFVP